MFPGFQEQRIATPEGEIFARIGGSGPPLLLLHGYPQTSAMWHLVAPDLARDYTVVAADLRGYGRSFVPAAQDDHAQMSKRAMAADMAAAMAALGHDRFRMVAHDRGGRVAHRLAADHPDRVQSLTVLDIAPTREMYRDGGFAFAQTYWHWYWLTQPAPMPEHLIGADPAWYWKMKCKALGASIFAPEAEAEYLAAWTPEVIGASCEDYRAAATIDLTHDDADVAAGRRLAMPVQALWGLRGAIERHFDCLALWRERADDVQGQALPGGHYLAEEHPEDLLAALRPFLAAAPA
ncbi:alpha/beta fold hydrolase [Jannaschia pohangensis]|uniref:Haloacetate dehalogenase n=1 Tax=Jannaschia pohangensis TaxID=390807 RepID=A0A1I3GK95_9RHOB|nr:alpha/beta hydrolase [Jannaschia pohangensis]SFI23863.1 haloacetate dehalogenase [Jannaschia pohangensis]